MQIVNLSPGFDPYNADKVLDYSYYIYAGGEPQFSFKDPVVPERTLVSIRLNTADDLFKLAACKKSLDYFGVKEVEVFIPYFPGARQDRITTDCKWNSFEYYAKLINDLNFSLVKSLSIHNRHQARVLINNFEEYNSSDMLHNFFQSSVTNDVVLLWSDMSAKSRFPTASNIVKQYARLEAEVIFEKIRLGKEVTSRPLAGTKMELLEDPNLCYLLIDDICDGGATFLNVKKFVPSVISAFFSHGIFRGNADKKLVEAGFRLFSTNSIKEQEAEFVNTIYLNG